MNPLLIQNVAVALIGRLHSPVGEALRHRDQDFLTAMMSLRLRMTTRLIDQPLQYRLPLQVGDLDFVEGLHVGAERLALAPVERLSNRFRSAA